VDWHFFSTHNFKGPEKMRPPTGNETV